LASSGRYYPAHELVSTYVDGVLLNTYSIAPPAGGTVGSLETDGQSNPPRGVPGPDWAINLGEDGTGLYATNNGAGIDCLMDDVGIWRRALTANEVQEIYTKGAVSGQTLEQEPVFASVLPVSYAMPAGSVNTNQPGFRVRPYQTATTGGGTIAWNNNQQAGLYGPNLADLSGADANGYYTVTNVLNWSISGGSVDGFPAADPFPGIGAAGTVNFSEQVLTYVEFPTNGNYLLGVNSDDGFGVTASVLNPKIFRPLSLWASSTVTGVLVIHYSRWQWLSPAFTPCDCFISRQVAEPMSLGSALLVLAPVPILF